MVSKSFHDMLHYLFIKFIPMKQFFFFLANVQSYKKTNKEYLRGESVHVVNYSAIVLQWSTSNPWLLKEEI